MYNLETCNPTDFVSVGNYHTVKLKDNTKGVALFFLIGIVMHSEIVSQRAGHQICVVPSDITWARAAATLGCFFNQRKLSLNTFKMGVSFSTLKPKENNPARKPFSTFGMSTGSSSTNISLTANNPLPADVESELFFNLLNLFHLSSTLVPAYDGRSPFALGMFRNNPKIIEEITPRLVIMVTFSLGAYELTSGVAMTISIKYGVSCNVQSIILLTDPTPQDTTLDIPSNINLHPGVLSDTNQ
jgi:hypothetical protein